MPKSITFTMVCTMPVALRAPAGEPTAITGRPPFRTNVGVASWTNGWVTVRVDLQDEAGNITDAKGDRSKTPSAQSDPDLFIRTGGEHRISNFLLWNLAYTELYFCDCLWPDFDDAEIERAFRHFAARQRRFGLTGDQVSGG